MCVLCRDIGFFVPALRSTMYPVIWDPPSLEGALHVSVQDLPVMSDGTGTPGALGGAEIIEVQV